MAESQDKAVQMGLFPTLDSIDAVVALGMSQLPITTPNQLMCLLMTYQNTLLALQAKEKDSHAS